MEDLQMDSYKPYAKMGKTCEARDISEKKVIWPDIDREIFHGKFRIRPIYKKDLDKVVELWKMSYPEVYGSSYEWILSPNEYEKYVALKDSWEHDSVNKKHAMIAIEEIETGNLATITLFTKDDKNLHIEVTFGGMHPDYRKGKTGTRLWSEGIAVVEWAESSGAEYITMFCETWHNISQYLALKQIGYKIAGIFPGQFTRWQGGQREYRGCEVHFYKFVGDGEKYVTKPEEWRLIPEVKKLWEVLEEINKESDDKALRKFKERRGE